MKMQIITIHDVCAICGKTPQMALHRPHSLQKTKKVVHPNLGKWQGMNICARCRKTLSKVERVRKVQPAQTTEA
jgi:ribosomal protein L28